MQFRATGFQRSSQRHRRRPDPQVALRQRIGELAAARVRYGYRRLRILLRREGWLVNHKRTCRLYREEGLSIRAKLPRRKRAWRYREARSAIDAPNAVWALDFMSGRLFDDRSFRLLTVIDCHTREALSIAPRVNFRACWVAGGLGGLVRQRDRRGSLRAGNGPEFAGRLLDQWAYLNGVEIEFSRPGKPADNARPLPFIRRRESALYHLPSCGRLEPALTRASRRLHSKNRSGSPPGLRCGCLRS